MAVISEDTKINLKINNIWAIFVSIVVSSFIVGIYVNAIETKLDTVLDNQKLLSLDFKDWKKQAELRLGTLEIATQVNLTKIEGL